MTSIKLMLNKCRILNNGTYPLVFQIIHNRRKRLIYIKYRLKNEEFHALTCEICVASNSTFSESDALLMNRKLGREQKKIEKVLIKLNNSESEFSVDDIVNHLKDSNSRRSSVVFLLEYMRTQIDKKIKIRKEGTAAAYRSTLASLLKYIGTTCLRKSDIKLSEINIKFVMGYEAFLQQEGVSENTISYYLRNFRTIYNNAAQEGCVLKENYPFIHVHTKPCRTVKRALSLQNMRDIVKLNFHDMPDVEFSRDLYLFSFYAQGMSFVDVVFLKKENISGGILTYSRHKSKQLISILITSQLQFLINKYISNSEYVFPILNPLLESSLYKQYRSALARINRHLKYIAVLIGMDIVLTTYTARHTWATLARYSGAPVSVISAGLGHTSEEVTRIYLKDFDLESLACVNNNVTKLVLSQ
ncbi:MAG: site-specific integrase [Bacteroides sp.]|jgi:integrase|nr:site-specific integrase [Bacteroides sp.]